MAIALGQRAIWSWTDKDSTERLNEKFRAVLSPGIYFGFLAIPDQTGLGGMNINIMLPRDSYMNDYYGILTDNSMVVIQEVQDDTYASGANTDPAYLMRDHDGTTPPDEPTWIGVVTTAFVTGKDRLDAVVCRHEYLPEVEEASNKATYLVLEGPEPTNPGDPPDPPALDPDDIVIAYIYVPDSVTAITADMIRNVTPIGPPEARPDRTYWQDVVEPGTYNGLDINVHSLTTGLPIAPYVDISAGSRLTKEGWKITEAADLNLNLTLTACGGAALTKIVYVVMAHKYEDIWVPNIDPDDPGYAIPTPDYLVINGSEVASDGSLGDVPVPTGTQIRAALVAIDSKYDTDDYMDYVNILGAITVTGTGPGYFYETSEPKKVLPRDMSVWLTPSRPVVIETPPTYNFPSGPLAHLGFWGIDDLEWLLERIVERNNEVAPIDTNSNNFRQPYRIELHGLGFLPTPLSVPSFVTLDGPAVLLSPNYRDGALTTLAVDASGYSAKGDTTHTVFLGTYNGAIDGNFDSYTIAVQVDYQNGRALSKRRFTRGDLVKLDKGDGSAAIACYFDEIVTDWSFKVWCWNTDDPTLKESANALIAVYKNGFALSQLRVLGDVDVTTAWRFTVHSVECDNADLSKSTSGHIDNFMVNTLLTAKPLTGPVSGQIACWYLYFGRVLAADFDLVLERSTIQHLSLPLGVPAGSIFTISGVRTLISEVVILTHDLTLDDFSQSAINFIRAANVALNDCDTVTVNLIEGDVVCDSDCSRVSIQDVEGTFDEGGVWSNIVIGQFYRATGTETFPGGGSSVTIDFGVEGLPDMPNANYSVDIDYGTTASGDPDVGEITIDKTTGDFTVKNSGVNAVDTFRWTLTYREP